MILQTDSTNENIQKWGCYFVILGGAVEKLAHRVIDDKLLTKVYDDCIQMGYIRTDCYILRPDMVMQVYADVLGVEIEVQFLYKYKDGNKTIFIDKDFWIGNANFFASYFVIDTDNDHQIDDENNGHFIETTGSGKIVFDPLGNSRAGNCGKIHSCRCFYVGKK